MHKVDDAVLATQELQIYEITLLRDLACVTLGSMWQLWVEGKNHYAITGVFRTVR